MVSFNKKELQEKVNKELENDILFNGFKCKIISIVKKTNKIVLIVYNKHELYSVAYHMDIKRVWKINSLNSQNTYMLMLLTEILLNAWGD